MFKKDTVLVLGAGASKEYNYPLGSELTEQILAFPATNADVVLGVPASDYSAFVTALREAQTTIDAFLAERPEFLNAGKAAIAYVIDYIERQDLFSRQKWYKRLLDKIGRTYDEVRSCNRLSVITFNYDRSLEHYLFTALKARCNRPDDLIVAALSNIEIIHVYGMLGSLPWQNKTTPAPRAYGDVEIKSMRESASGIRLIHERNEDVIQDRCDSLLTDAERVFILGFGFLPENQRWLRNIDVNRHRVLATAVGMTPAERTFAARLYKLSFLGDNYGQECDTYLRHSEEFLND